MLNKILDGLEALQAAAQRSLVSPCSTEGWSDDLRTALWRLIVSSVAIGSSRLRRKVKDDLRTIHEVSTQELHSRLVRWLDVSNRDVVRHDQSLRHIAEKWWQGAGERIKDSWTGARPIVEFSPDMTSDDEALADMWRSPNRSRPPSSLRRGSYEHEADDDDRQRCYAARRAEKSAKLFYEQFDCAVEDVAIAQLTGRKRP